jgi:hypothetical protein
MPDLPDRDRNRYPTLADVNVFDEGIGRPLVDESIHQHKEIERFPASIIDGTSLTLSVLTKLPEVGFRKANEGVLRQVVQWESKEFSTAYLESQTAADPAVVYASKNPARFLESFAKPFMDAFLSKICKQIWYGKEYNDPDGFVGILQQYSPDAKHELDLGQDKELSSVWFLNLAPENLELVFGNNRAIHMRNWRQETIYKEDPLTKQVTQYDGLTSAIHGCVGLRLSNKHAAFRIKNIGPQTITGTGLNKTYSGGLNDDHFYTVIEKFHEINRVPPNAIFGHPRSFEQLRKSRIAVNGAGAPVPEVSSFEGIPIFRTINIRKDEERLITRSLGGSK